MSENKNAKPMIICQVDRDISVEGITCYPWKEGIQKLISEF